MKYSYLGHELNVDLWESKEALFRSFYTDFYSFIKNHDGETDLLAHNIHNAEDFIHYADYYADGKENCYAMGFSFHKYYLHARMDGSLESEPTTSFIGWCYHNHKYLDFLNFLVTFFAWWRNDEGCTRMDPYNYADNFFVSSWAALVDTSKLFYFTSETVYFWQSYRVKYVLDNIPGTFKTDLPTAGLPKVRISGYEFLGWVDQDGNELKKDQTYDIVYASLKRKDFYDYWGKEEKQIKKVYVDNWTKVDPV